jgi:alpha-1,3-rhamnosyltransferase
MPVNTQLSRPTCLDDSVIAVEDDLVSVVVPSYNHVQYVRQTIESVLQQSHPHIELIVIDDHSSDGSSELLQQLAAEHGFSLVLKPCNEGVVKTLNDGLALARGRYFCPCASDDYWAPEKIRLQLQEFRTNSLLKLSFTEGFEVDARGMILGPVRYTSRQKEAWDFEDVLFKADLPPASFMARRADMLAVGGYDGRFKIEDLAMWLMLLQCGGHATVVKQGLAFYRNHSTNMHTISSSMVIDEHYRIVNHFSQGHPKRQSILAEWRLRNGNFLAGRDRQRSMQYLRAAWKHVDDYRLWAGIFKNVVRWK